MTKLNVKDANSGNIVEVDLDSPSGSLYIQDANTGNLKLLDLANPTGTVYIRDANTGNPVLVNLDNLAGTISMLDADTGDTVLVDLSSPTGSVHVTDANTGNLIEVDLSKNLILSGNTDSGELSYITKISTVLAPVVTITKPNNTDVRLGWSAVTGATSYNIYRGTMPYFTPSDTPYATTSNLTYDDTNILGNPSTKYFYVVKSIGSHGLKSGISNRVGKFEYSLIRDNLSVLAVPLIDTRLTNADSLGTLTQSSIVSRWSAASQVFATRSVGTAGSNFAISTGQVYLVNSHNSPNPTSIFANIGGVPSIGSIVFSLTRNATPKINSITLPLHLDNITTADQLALAIGGVGTISIWINNTQSFDSRLVGQSGNNFSTLIGQPYWPACDTTGGNPTWPF